MSREYDAERLARREEIAARLRVARERSDLASDVSNARSSSGGRFLPRTRARFKIPRAALAESA